MFFFLRPKVGILGKPGQNLITESFERGCSDRGRVGYYFAIKYIFYPPLNSFYDTP